MSSKRPKSIAQSRGVSTRNAGAERPMVKFILLGCCGVGKTAILNRFCDGRFLPNTHATIGVDFKFRDIEMENGEAYRLHVWDTAGQEQFHVVSKPYYRQADAVVLVYDCTSPDSLNTLDRYVNEARDLCPLGTPMALLGNKCDLLATNSNLENSQIVFKSEAEQFAKRRGIPVFFETSAANGQCIDEAFEVLCRHAVNNRRANGDLREIGLNNGLQGTEAGRSATGRSMGPRGNVRFVQRNSASEANDDQNKKCKC